MITTANASAPKNLGISQCQQDRNDMRAAFTDCRCNVGNISDNWASHWAWCLVYAEGQRIADRKEKVWNWFINRRTA